METFKFLFSITKFFSKNRKAPHNLRQIYNSVGKKQKDTNINIIHTFVNRENYLGCTWFLILIA